MIVYKTDSAGNEFVHLETGPGLLGPDRAALAKAVCREFAADGVVFHTPGAAGIGFDIWNRDGSRAELSGNGMAGCAAVQFLRRRGGRELRLLTAVGPRTVQRLGRDGRSFRLRVEIGPADFAGRRHFPFREDGRFEYEFAAVRFHPLGVGNPHAVVLLDAEPQPGPLARLGAELEGAPIFPERCNVEFAFVRPDGSCRVFFWERGAGHTAASSTGSAAVFAVLRRLGLAGDSLRVDGGGEPVTVGIRPGSESITVENTTRVRLRADWSPG